MRTKVEGFDFNTDNGLIQKFEGKTFKAVEDNDEWSFGNSWEVYVSEEREEEVDLGDTKHTQIVVTTRSYYIQEDGSASFGREFETYR